MSASAHAWTCHCFLTDAQIPIQANATTQEISLPSVVTTTGLTTTSVAVTTPATGRRIARPAL